MDWREVLQQQKMAVFEAERAKELAYKENWKPGMPPPIPSSLSSLSSELDDLKQIGGPARVDGLPPEATISFDRACSKFWEVEVLEIVMDYTSDLVLARRLWPWVAQTLHWYEVAARLADPSKDLTPKGVAEVLSSVRRLTMQLDDLLEKLHQSWTISRDGAPYKAGHLEYLHHLLVQGASGFASADIDMDVKTMMKHFDRYRDFRFRLDALGKSAAYAQEALDKSLLTSTNRFQTPGIQDFVQRLGLVWKVLANKEPKAYKVPTRDPPVSTFVRFVQRIAMLSDRVAVPQLKTVEAALKAPPDW